MAVHSSRNVKPILVLSLALLLAMPAAAATRSKASKHSSASSAKTSVQTTKTSGKSAHSKSSSKRASSKKSKHVKAAGWRTKGQQAIDPNRAREIQAALIRAHYLDGAPTGTWDPRSKAAMEKFQADNGWQTKKIPDARALIKLGLGPDHADLLNPDTALISQPDVLKGGGVPNNNQQ